MSVENLGPLIDQASLHEKEWQSLNSNLLKAALCVSVLVLSYLTVQSILHADPYFSFRGAGGLTGVGGITVLYASGAINLLLVSFAILSARQSAQCRKEKEDLSKKQMENSALEKRTTEKLQESKATSPASSSTSSTQTESPPPHLTETNLSVALPSSLSAQRATPVVTHLTTEKVNHSLRPKPEITFVFTSAQRNKVLTDALSHKNQWNFSIKDLILIQQQSQTTRFVTCIPILVLTKKAHPKEIFVIPASTKLPFISPHVTSYGSLPNPCSSTIVANAPLSSGYSSHSRGALLGNLSQPLHSSSFSFTPTIPERHFFSSSCVRKLNSTKDQILLFLSQLQGDENSSVIVGSDKEPKGFAFSDTFNQNKSHTSPPPFIPIKASAPSTFSTQLFSSTSVGTNSNPSNISASSSFSTSSITLPAVGMFSSSILSSTTGTSSSLAKQPTMTIQKLEGQITKIIGSIKGLLESMIRCEYSRNVPGWYTRRSNLNDRLQALNTFFQGIEKSYLPTKNLQMSIRAILVSLSYERLLNVKMKALKAVFNQVQMGGKEVELFQPCLRQCEALIKYRNGLTQACQVFSNQSSSINDVRDAIVAIFEGLKLAYKTESQLPLVDTIVTFLEKKLSSLIHSESVANKLLNLKMKTEDELFSGILDTLLEALTPKELETWLIQNESSIVEGISRTIKANLAKFQIPLHLFLRDTLPLFRGENPGPNFSAHFHQVFQAHLLLEGNSKVSQQKELEQLAGLETHEADNLALIVVPEDQVLAFNFDQWVLQKPQSLFSTITSKTLSQDMAKCKEKGLIEIPLKNNTKVHAAFVPSPGRLDFGISWTQFTSMQWISFGMLKSVLGITPEQMPIISNLFDALINALYYGAIAPVDGYPFEEFRVQIAKFVGKIDPTQPIDQLVENFEKFLEPLTKQFLAATEDS